MTWSQSEYHCGFATMTSELRSDLRVVGTDFFYIRFCDRRVAKTFVPNKYLFFASIPNVNIDKMDGNIIVLDDPSKAQTSRRLCRHDYLLNDVNNTKSDASFVDEVDILKITLTIRKANHACLRQS
jgi:hypothetical protein